MGPVTFSNCMCEFLQFDQIYFFFFFAPLLFKLVIHIFLSCILQICVINLIRVGLRMKQALQVYFPIHEFQFNDF